MIHLYLVRHGENLANITKEFSCRLVDYPLTPKGALQARQTAEHFASRRIDAVYSSPLKRARQTALPIAALLGLTPIVIENLREINVGTLELEPPSLRTWDLHNQILTDWYYGKYDETFPGGENFHGMWARARDALLQIARGGDARSVVAVGHGGMFTYLIRPLCPGADEVAMWQTPNHNCSITEIELDVVDGEPVGRLLRWADSSHLYGEAAQFVHPLPEPGEFE
jgi:broad specificity phosphatase PhoE